MPSDFYKQQWDEEKKMFFDGLKKRNYLLLENSIHIFYPGTENTNDPRTIAYEFGDNRLKDDHFSMQHSEPLSCKELSDIFFILKKEGIDVEQYDIYYECNGIFSGQGY